jgi:hypothetical protein
MQKILNFLFLFILVPTLCMSVAMAQGNKPTKKPKEKTPPPAVEVFKVPPMMTDFPKDEEADYKELHTTFENFIKAYSSIQKTKDKQSVLQYLSKDVKATFILFDIANNSNIKYTNLKSFDTHLDDLIKSDEMELKYTVTEMLREYIQAKFALVSYVVNFEIYKNGNLWSKGNETVTLTYIKFQGEWKVVQYTFVSIEDEKLRGSCVCEVFKGKSGEQFVSKMAIPTGRSYVTNMTDFKFTDEKTGDKTIKANKYLYRWAKSGEVWLKNYDQTGVELNETKLGDAADKKDVVKVILGKHLFMENCVDMRLSMKD